MRVLFDLRTPAIIGAFRNARMVFIIASIDRYEQAYPDPEDREVSAEEIRPQLHHAMHQLMRFIKDGILVYHVDAGGTLCVEDAVIDHFKEAYGDFYEAVGKAFYYTDQDVLDDIVEIMDEFFTALYDITEQELTMVGNFLCEFT